MADDNWKEEVERKIDEAHQKGEIDDDLYKKLKKLLKLAKTAGEFAKALEKEGLLKKLAGKKKIGWKPAGILIDILIQLVEAGPCPWVGIILARIHKLKTDAVIYDDWKTYERLEELKKKYSKHYDQCIKKANGKKRPKDINRATVSDLRRALGDRLAAAVVREAADEPFQTPWELLRVRGVRHEHLMALLERGFYFGVNGPQMVGLMHLVPEGTRGGTLS